MNHDHVVFEYMGAECSTLRQPMRAIFALSRAQLLLLVVTRSRELSRECHVTKHKTPARSNFPLSNFENSGTIQFSSSRSTSRGLCPKFFEKRAHPIVPDFAVYTHSYSLNTDICLHMHSAECTVRLLNQAGRNNYPYNPKYVGNTGNRTRDI